MSKADRRARKRDNKQLGRAEREAEAKRRKQRSGLIRGGIVVAAIVVVFGVILWTGRKDEKKATPVTKPGITCTHTKPARGSTKTYKKAPAMTIDAKKKYTATMTTSCGTVVIALDPKAAPLAVNSFVFLAKAKFFDGLSFHRVVPDFVVQGGDPTGTGSGGPGYSLPEEEPPNGYKPGSVAMANASSPNTTGSQFFLTWSKNGITALGGPPYKYSLLGQITKGLDVVKKMGTFDPESGDGPPTKPLYIAKVTISES